MGGVWGIAREVRAFKAEGGLLAYWVVEVDEEGATAAAGTHYDGMVMDTPPVRVIDFLVTRPFLFLITEQSTGTILFMGRVTRMDP